MAPPFEVALTGDRVGAVLVVITVRVAVIGTGPEGGGVYIVPATAANGPPSEPVVVYESADRPPFYLYWTPKFLDKQFGISISKRRKPSSEASPSMPQWKSARARV